MFLTLLVVPTAYSLLESAKLRAGKLFRRRASAQPAGATTAGAGIASGFENGAEHTVEATLTPPTVPATSVLSQGNGHDASNGDKTVSPQPDSQEVQ
jgi:hypothetical protein